jgi:hypothetical protein
VLVLRQAQSGPSKTATGRKPSWQAPTSYAPQVARRRYGQLKSNEIFL